MLVAKSLKSYIMLKVVFFSISSTQQFFSSVLSIQRSTRNLWLIQPYVLHPQQWPCFSLSLVRQGGESNTFTLPDSETAIQRNTHTETNTQCSTINYKMLFYFPSRKLCSCEHAPHSLACYTFFKTHILNMSLHEKEPSQNNLFCYLTNIIINIPSRYLVLESEFHIVKSSLLWRSPSLTTLKTKERK